MSGPIDSALAVVAGGEACSHISQDPKSVRRRWHGSRRWWLWLAVSTGILMLAAFVALALSPQPSLVPHGGYSQEIVDRHGALLRLHLAQDERYRLHTPLDEIAAPLLDATLLYEDRYFYRHPGVNPVALTRAAWQTYVTGNRPVGASTITMQLARLRYGLNTRTVCGKLVQIARAAQLEWHYDKRDILEAYLNHAPYGGNVEGIGTAARVYFDKPASELTPGEALALAVVPQNPVGRDPARSVTRPALLAARDRLTQRYAQQIGLNDEQRARIALPLAVRSASSLPFLAPHLVQAEARVDASADEAAQRVMSTLDLSLQRDVEAQVNRHLTRQQSRGLDNAAVMVVDHRSMDVVASVGSAAFFDAALEGQVDGTRAKRSPGSTLKPFVYGLAIDDGLIHPMSLMKDAPSRYAAYAPENFDGAFLGPVNATAALNLSRNVPAINLLQRVGHERFHALLERGGVRGLRDADHYGLSMVLGGNELTMRELVVLYAALANSGRLQPLRTRVNAPVVSGDRLLSPEASFLVLDMLRQNPRPDRIAGHGAPQVAWKTGTSYAYRDAWTVGVAGPYVVAVWVGHFDGRSNPALVGRTAATPLFFSLVDSLARDTVAWATPEPAPSLNLKRVDVCAPTGDLPGPHCPRTRQAWFVPGVSPIRVSTVHRAVLVDGATGFRACAPGPNTREAVFEFWPSDVAKVFDRAGIALRRPPAWHPSCDLATQQAHGVPPRITTPVPNLVYQRRSHRDDPLPLQAVTDSDARWLYWFANGDLIARVARDQAAYWPAPIGEHDIAVVDDLGRADRRRLVVARAP